MNDNAPEFLKPSYEVSIPEDAEAGSPILSVKARDGDGSSPNNEIVYRCLRRGLQGYRDIILSLIIFSGTMGVKKHDQNMIIIKRLF